MKELYHRLKNTNTTLHTYDVSEATTFSSGEHVNVVFIYCDVRVFKKMEKSFHLLLMCFVLLHCQEIPWCNKTNSSHTDQIFLREVPLQLHYLTLILTKVALPVGSIVVMTYFFLPLLAIREIFIHTIPIG